ncbi:PREDICTED: tyrosyl-DNA phosphodiesterase 1-like isoform X2 [Camelina sativa]|uniref:Tyrosyl-DNA phosphodiesterase 1-like isoform X2 n=1 Tax=Camelina sativa TaxID=90675 RepID=A0ABM0T326_CAMSA|nr:PREDICTED: tyrosyl-DNA phosphodiesterase 1-like isoform X2 [Camelina sativa]
MSLLIHLTYFSRSPLFSSLQPQAVVFFFNGSLSDLKEEDSSPRITLSEGPNIIGRGNVSIADKRLSRKHISITVSSSGSVSLSVEGTNPVVIRCSGDGERKKVKPREEVLVSNDDLIELIPGHHFFKLVLLPAENRGSHERAAKKARKDDAHDDDVEAIRRFVPPNEKLPSTFRLLSVNGLPDWANTSCVSINDVIEGDVVAAILSNYMVDVDWLMSACPKLANISQVMVIHGEGDGRQEYIQRKKPANWSLHKPRLPISFGTHHSKAIFLVYPRGVRVVVHTANLIHVDWNNKSQGLWMQDFPWKDDDNKDPPKCCGFEGDLIDYLNVLKWPEFTASLPGRGNVKINAAFFKKFDYSNATVRLIASVPGYHTGLNLKKWGHMKLRSILQECIFDREFRRSPLVYQFSSLGSLDEKWLAEFRDSLSCGITEDKTPLGPGDPLIIWPTVEDVRCSLEGYAAGNAIPSPLKNVEKPFLRKYWAKWKADHSARSRAMPHIKTFTRYSDQKLAWFLLTSSNLSKAAWGALQKNNSQLMIRSYELGVLFLSSPIKTQVCDFSCTEDNTSTMKAKQETKDEVVKERSKLVTMTWQGDKDSPEIISLPIPYQLPPKPYSPEDVPWSWDRGYSKKDVYGQVWPR